MYRNNPMPYYLQTKGRNKNDRMEGKRDGHRELSDRVQMYLERRGALLEHICLAPMQQSFCSGDLKLRKCLLPRHYLM